LNAVLHFLPDRRLTSASWQKRSSLTPVAEIIAFAREN
jgi:hypothetical protein